MLMTIIIKRGGVFIYTVLGRGSKGGRGCIYIVQCNKKFSRQNLDFVTVGKFNCYTLGAIRCI